MYAMDFATDERIKNWLKTLCKCYHLVCQEYTVNRFD